ncbi:hypothetical protein EJB05_14117 [Eragrostis curvula]|uniref:Uncharacterized protein n=1 Tax=Eragrostis curvula TaxID=38414 RepID=A0A5J9VXJ9_9POAL|nr:hypothetical protein EJB05_14117 [Eragrostis curvula]
MRLVVPYNIPEDQGEIFSDAARICFTVFTALQIWTCPAQDESARSRTAKMKMKNLKALSSSNQIEGSVLDAF